MKCGKHAENDAVGQCVKCSTGVCADCAKITELLRNDYGVLCVDCYINELTQFEIQSAKNFKWLKFGIILNSICYFIGIILLVTALIMQAVGSESEAIGKLAISGFVFCGAITAIFSFGAFGFELGANDNYVITSQGVYRQTSGCAPYVLAIIGAVVGLVLGIIVTPIKICFNARKMKKEKILLQNARQAIENAQAEFNSI